MESGLLRDMVDSRARAGKIWDESRIYCFSRNKKGLKKIRGSCKNDAGVSLKATPQAKSGIIKAWNE